MEHLPKATKLHNWNCCLLRISEAGQGKNRKKGRENRLEDA